MKTKLIGACSIVGVMIGAILLNESDAMFNLVVGGLLLVGGMIGVGITIINLRSQK